MPKQESNRKRVQRLNKIIEREFRKHIQVRVEQPEDREVIYVIVGETRYKMALGSDDSEFFFTALAQPSLTFPIPGDYK